MAAKSPKPEPVQADERREVRVFVSSTFSDMRREREYLNKEIFPKFRDLCRKRGVAFTEVDLQWGITEEQARQGGAIGICLEEVSRCRPHFIALIGERYGWVPKEEVPLEEVLANPLVSEEIKEKLQAWYQQGESVTAMEILHGVLEQPDQAPYSYFYFRSRELTERFAEEDKNRNAYVEQGEKAGRLKRLKQRIRRGDGPWHVRDYKDLEELGQLVLEDLKRALDARFPEQKKEETSPLEAERRLHRAFARSRLPVQTRHGSTWVEDEALSQAVMQALEQEKKRPVLVYGAPGLGKSTLLVNLARRWQARHGADAVLIEHYVGAGGAGDIPGLLQRLMAELQAHFPEAMPKEVPGRDEAEAQFAAWLLSVPKGRPVLLVVDAINQLAEEAHPERLVPLFPKTTGEVAVLLSSQDGPVVKAARANKWSLHEIRPMDEEARRALVERHLARYRKDLPEALKERLLKAEQADNPLFLRVVLDELRLEARHETLEEVLDFYLQAEDLVALFECVLARVEQDREHGGERAEEVFSLIFAARYGLQEGELQELLGGGAAVRALSFLLARVGDYLANLEGRIGFLHDAFREAVARRYRLAGKRLQALRRRLADFFAQVALGERQLDEYPWLLQRLGEEEELRAYLARLEVVAAFRARPRWREELLGYWRAAGCEADDHARALVRGWLAQARQWCERGDGEAAGRALNVAGEFMQFAGRYTEAERLLREALEMRRALLGARHPDVATSLDSLAVVLQDQGKLAEAERLLREALEMRRALLGVQHPDVATTLNNLALVLQDQGKLAEAERLLREALEMKRALLGAQHPDVATILNNLGLVLKGQGKLAEAERLYREALEIQRALLGAQHPDVATILNNLGLVLEGQGKHLATVEYFLRGALEMKRALLGAQHPDVATILNNLAEVLRAQGKVKEAEQLYREALEIQRALLGARHPAVATSLNNLALVLHQQGKLAEAERLLREALEMRRALLGAQHPDVLASLRNLAEVLRAQGKLDKAEQLYREALGIWKEHLARGGRRLGQSGLGAARPGEAERGGAAVSRGAGNSAGASGGVASRCGHEPE